MPATIVFMIVFLTMSLFLSVKGWTDEQKPVILTLPKTPSSLEAFTRLRDSFATTPEAGAALFVLVLNLYTENRDQGLPYVTAMLAKDPELTEPSKDGGFWRGFSPTMSVLRRLEYLEAQTGIARSFISGTSPKDDYRLPPGARQVFLTRNRFSKQQNGDIKVFIRSSGTSSPRAVFMAKNDHGIWKVRNFSNLVADVQRLPVLPHDDL